MYMPSFNAPLQPRNASAASDESSAEGATLSAGLCLICVLMLSGCADSVPLATAGVMEPVGFWYGLWHGLICPFAWIISLFDPDVAIYAVYNNGGWYDFGFVLGVGALGSSSAAKT